ncbi:Actin cytoskeleton-regulatory complex protein PAN1 [Fusarium oxysporum f. sp. albedinis]|nr:Actin cytoskeleton-regulatory complex protein PAN1 [Fusarium oxysporum f. sp. albedinis]
MSTQVPSKNRLYQQNITPSQVQALRGLELHYDISYQAIICLPCGFALKTDDDCVGCHLKEKHGISKKRRGKLNTLVNSLHLPDPDELPKRPDRSAQHPFLAL